MEIKERLEKDLKEALKKKEAVTVSTLRMLKAAIHNKEIEKRVEKLPDAEIIQVAAKQLQQRQESIEQFKKAGRSELVEKESKEAEILKKYLPEQMSEEKIQQTIKAIIQKISAKGKDDFGKVMKEAMKELRGKADGKLISRIVSRELGM